MYVAFNFRKIGDPLGSYHQGCYKRFLAIDEAAEWLHIRVSKTSISPKGRLIFHEKNDLSDMLARYFDSNEPKSLRLSIRAFLRYIGHQCPNCIDLKK